VTFYIGSLPLSSAFNFELYQSIFLYFPWKSNETNFLKNDSSYQRFINESVPSARHEDIWESWDKLHELLTLEPDGCIWSVLHSTSKILKSLRSINFIWNTSQPGLHLKKYEEERKPRCLGTGTISSFYYTCQESVRNLYVYKYRFSEGLWQWSHYQMYIR
jgi:hypothetical protein